MPGQSFSQHIANLRQVFERLRKVKLKLSPKKCILFQRKVQYLGHVVSEKGISPGLGKIEAVKTWLRPGTVKRLKAFWDSAPIIVALSLHLLKLHILLISVQPLLRFPGLQKQKMLSDRLGLS